LTTSEVSNNINKKPMPALDSIKEAYEDYLKKVYPNNDISDAQKRHIKLAFYGGTPVAKAAAYTQTYSTADRTLSAYTADNESGAYTGIDNAQAGSVYATLTDLNALRTAYENWRAFVEDIAGMLNSTVDDLQALNLVG